jgi:phenylacetate-CoA ligase
MRSDKIRAALMALKPSLLPGPRAQASFEWQLRLTNSQWAARPKLEAHQLSRLKPLVRFAAQRVPYWRGELVPDQIEDAGSLQEALDRLPILSRDALRDNAEDFRAETLPKGHTAGVEKSSSGSTGMVVRVLTSNVSLRWQGTLGLRSHLWAGRDFTRSIAVIRRMEKGKGLYPGVRARRWAGVNAIPFRTGRAFQLSATESLEQQWEWLAAINPTYFLTVPSILRQFAARPSEEIARLTSLAGISTIGEVVDEELRTLARERLGAPIHDLYSSEEAGCLAIECPDAPFYHVVAEAMILEILDETGRPCLPGQVGRVVITPLVNYATPLIRYELGDYAEAAGDCPCGRTLPALKRIIGRRRNLMMTPDGRHFWPTVRARAIQQIVKVRAHQFRQIAPDAIEVWLAAESAVTPEQESELRKALLAGLPAPFRLSFHYVDAFPPHPGGKHEEFVSLLTTTTPPRLD